MPKEYRLSYPCDLFVSVEADSLDEAKQKLVDCLAELSGQGDDIYEPVEHWWTPERARVLEALKDYTEATHAVIVCLDHPKSWTLDPGERLYPRQDGDGPVTSLVQLEDGPDEDEDDEEAPVEGGPAAEGAPQEAGGREAGAGA